MVKVHAHVDLAPEAYSFFEYFVFLNAFVDGLKTLAHVS